MYKINEKGQVYGELDGKLDVEVESKGCDDSSYVKSRQNEFSSNADDDSEDVDDVNSTVCE